MASNALEDGNLAVSCGILYSFTLDEVYMLEKVMYIFLCLADHDVPILVALCHINELPDQGWGPGDGGDLWLLLQGFRGHIRW